MLEESKRNGFAVAGFVLSLFGMIVTVTDWVRFIDPINEVIVTVTDWIPLKNFTKPEKWPDAILIAIGVLVVLIAIGVPEVLGIIFSSVGIAKTRKGFGGKKLAIAGLILGGIAFFEIIGVILEVVVSSFS